MNLPSVNEAINAIEHSTRPDNIYKLNRADYGNINVAFQVLAEFIKKHSEEAPPAEAPKKRGRPAKGAFGSPGAN
jgi:hypothetical protein